MLIAKVNNIELEYEICGQGFPLVLIAGLGYPRWIWHMVIPELSKHFQVISFDNRGVGNSTVTPGSYTAQLLAEDTIALLDYLKIKKAHIAGHSMGGFIAQALVTEFPDRIENLVLLATNYGGTNIVPITPKAMQVLMNISLPPVERFMAGLEISCAPGFSERNKELVKQWLEYRMANPVSADGYRSQLGIGLSLMNPLNTFQWKLKNISHKTLIMFGDEDNVVPSGNAHLLSNVISKSSICIIPNVGHFIMMEAPEKMIAEFITFLKN